MFSPDELVMGERVYPFVDGHAPAVLSWYWRLVKIDVLPKLDSEPTDVYYFNQPKYDMSGTRMAQYSVFYDVDSGLWCLTRNAGPIGFKPVTFLPTEMLDNRYRNTWRDERRPRVRIRGA